MFALRCYSLESTYINSEMRECESLSEAAASLGHNSWFADDGKLAILKRRACWVLCKCSHWKSFFLSEKTGLENSRFHSYWFTEAQLHEKGERERASLPFIVKREQTPMFHVPIWQRNEKSVKTRIMSLHIPAGGGTSWWLHCALDVIYPWTWCTNNKIITTIHKMRQIKLLLFHLGRVIKFIMETFS